MKADDAAIRPRSVVPNQFHGLYAAFRGPVALDPRAGVMSICGVSTRVSPNQYRIMLALLAAAPHCVPYANLIDAMYVDDPNGGAVVAVPVVRQHVHYLRRALLILPGDVRLSTAYGFGVRLTGLGVDE